jgi:hypothetical protein
MRLSRIESGADGWQGTAWLLERLYPTRFSKPEIQISLSNSFNQTFNALSITIAPEEARAIEDEAEPVREHVGQLMADYLKRRDGAHQGEQAAAASAVSLEVQRKFADYRPASGNGG